ncbi:bacterio-opsin activator-like protein [Haloferax elongans ATCC BAA-1513]|uniref:Bacterio-opsin activator-like protein n=1 Tax=Haloferax elongans ATCC BAA-1513 TaxID=1230453 RepID=M0HJX6_HALEO|nr:bacterio-opsin activator domain-containing protein [Haloferax elongans]ELZ84801.1 bacterio-opsin activator-like protein [Haloferax elongans ATCC BAA-1513]
MGWPRDTFGTAQEWAVAYDRLRRATETYREDLVVRLGAEVGLQPTEMSRLTPAHVATGRPRGTDLTALSVPDDDRTAYLPADVEHDLRKFVAANDVGDSDRVFPVTARRLQMLVSTVGERAAERFDQDELADVSSRDLRNYYAKQLLAEGVHPSVVLRVGGWNRLESLSPFVDAPAETAVIEALSSDTGGYDSGGGVAHTSSGRRPDVERSTTGVGTATSSRLSSVVELVRETSAALSDATTRDELEQTLCERLGRSNAYRFAWISAANTASGASQTAVGIDEAGLSDVRRVVPDSGEPADSDGNEALVRTSNVSVSSESGVVDSDGGPVAITTVSLVHGETTFGRLHLGTSPGTVSTGEQSVLATLGQQAGAALTAVERKKLLLADTVTRLRFQCTDDGSVLVRVSDALGCTVALRGVAPIADRSLLCFLAVSGVKTDRAFDELDAAPEISNVRLVRDRGEESVLEIVLSGESLLSAVTARDGTVSEFVAEDGTASFVVSLSNEIPLRTVIAELTDAYPDTELRSKREVERDPQHATDFRESVEGRLTDKQHSALRAAFLAGYFEWPRESTAEDLADSLDVSSPTLHQHLRTAQQKLLHSFFDDLDASMDH